MAVNLQGLEDNARKTSIEELNARLADGLALGMAIKQAHWNVKGPNFIAVHELFDTVHARLLTHLDEMAEQVQTLDGVARGTAEVVAADSTLEAYPTDLTKAQDHIKAVCDRMRDYGAKLRKGVTTTEEAGDLNTSDLLTSASRTADKDLWFLESHLE